MGLDGLTVTDPQCRLHVMLFMQQNNKENLPEFIPPLSFCFVT